MKLLKKLVAIASVVAVMGTTAFASIQFDSNVEIEAEATSVEIKISMPTGSTVGAFSYFNISWDKSIFSIDEDGTSVGYGELDSYDEESAYWSSMSDVTVGESTGLITFKLNIIGDADNAVITVGDWCMYADGEMSVEIAEPSNTIITVSVKEGGDDDKVTTSTSTLGATVVNYPADYSDAKNFDGKYIVFKDGTIPSYEITKDTTFNVTYDNTTKNFGGSIFKTLDVEGTGTIATGTYRIGVAFDFDVAPGDVTIVVAE